MKVVIAIDSFKGSLSSLEAGEAAKRGILKSNPQAQVEIRPLADGGEGTVEALVQGMGGRTCKVTVTGPLGNPVEAEYGIVGENTAVIEMSAAAGITLVPDQMRNPLYTTTYGVGEMIKDAVEKGCRRFLVGIGGSATNDGGVGMLQALGYEFLDAEGNEVPLGARGLEQLSAIKDEKVLPQLKECEFRVACGWVLMQSWLEKLFLRQTRKNRGPEQQAAWALLFLLLQTVFWNQGYRLFWKKPDWKIT